MKNNKEKSNIYSVTFRDKSSTPIKTDLEIIEDAIIDYVIHYVKGYQNPDRKRGLGAEHIKLHLGNESQGQITLEELLNLGKSLREYVRVFGEPFIDDKGAKIFEWENNEKVRFRVIADVITERHIKDITQNYQKGGSLKYATIPF